MTACALLFKWSEFGKLLSQPIRDVFYQVLGQSGSFVSIYTTQDIFYLFLFDVTSFIFRVPFSLIKIYLNEIKMACLGI